MAAGKFHGYDCCWHRLGGKTWPVWVCARSRREAGIIALLTFALLEAQEARRP